MSGLLILKNIVGKDIKIVYTKYSLNENMGGIE